MNTAPMQPWKTVEQEVVHMVGPMQRPSLAGMVADELLKLIEARNLGENDPLPPTAELSELLGVSRTVVREAIAELAGQGLLITRQGKETLVSLPSADRLERFLRLRFVVRGADYRSLHDYRVIIEVGAARLAAQRANADDIAALAERLAALREASTGETSHVADHEFHREVARISGNDMLLVSHDGIAPLFADLRLEVWVGLTQSGADVEPGIEAHADLLRAIEKHDVDGAERAMRGHLDLSLRLLEKIEQGLNPSLALQAARAQQSQ